MQILDKGILNTHLDFYFIIPIQLFSLTKILTETRPKQKHFKQCIQGQIYNLQIHQKQNQVMSINSEPHPVFHNVFGILEFDRERKIGQNGEHT